MYEQTEVALGGPAKDDTKELLTQKAMIQGALAKIAGKVGKFQESLNDMKKPQQLMKSWVTKEVLLIILETLKAF
ncbi:MAG: hypothetical protein ACI9O4_000815 [Chitinophagales bacterium]